MCDNLKDVDFLEFDFYQPGWDFQDIDVGIAILLVERLLYSERGQEDSIFTFNEERSLRILIDTSKSWLETNEDYADLDGKK